MRDARAFRSRFRPVVAAAFVLMAGRALALDFGTSVVVDSTADAPYCRIDPVVAAGPGSTRVVAWVPDSATDEVQTVVVSRSADAGRTWSPPAEVRTELREPHYHITELALDTDGAGTWLLVRTTYDVYGSPTPSHLAVDVTVSIDDGVSWGAPEVIVDETAGSYDSRTVESPHLRSNGDGTWVLVWKARTDVDPQIDFVEMSRSTDNGASWSSPVALNDDTGGMGTCCTIAITDLLLEMDSAGSAVVLWSGYDYPYPVFRSFSTDAGATWAPHVYSETGWEGYWSHPHATPSLATDGEGLWMAAWSDYNRSGSDYESLYLTTSTDHGATWTDKRLLLWYGTGLFAEPRVLSHGRGHWQIVWASRDSLGATVGSDADLLTIYSRDDGTTWTDASPLLEEASSDAGVNDVAFSTGKSASSTAVAWRSSTNADECAVRFASAMQDCPSLPRPDCLDTTAAGGSSLKLATGVRDRITWKWVKGEETLASQIGAPEIGDDYVFCLYENDTVGPRLIGEWDAEAGTSCGTKPCWVVDGSRATYNDRELLQGSVRRLRIKGGEGRPSSLRADLAGLAIAPPAPPMNDTAPVTMQLLNLGTGACWSGDHTTTDRNDTGRFESSSN